MVFDIDIVSVGFDNNDRKLVQAECVSEDLVKLLIEKYGNAANKIYISSVPCDGCDEE